MDKDVQVNECEAGISWDFQYNISLQIPGSSVFDSGSDIRLNVYTLHNSCITPVYLCNKWLLWSVDYFLS